MQNHALASPGVSAVCHLLIHAKSDDGSNGWSVESLVQRIRAHVLDGPRGERPPTRLEIRDLEGQRVLAIDGACTLVDVALSPGTYHVRAELTGTRRSYTVALEPGASFDLYLRLARKRP